MRYFRAILILSCFFLAAWCPPLSPTAGTNTGSNQTCNNSNLPFRHVLNQRYPKKQEQNFVPGELIIKLKSPAFSSTNEGTTSADIPAGEALQLLAELHHKFQVQSVTPLFSKSASAVASAIPVPLSTAEVKERFATRSKRAPRNFPTPDLSLLHKVTLHKSSDLEQALNEYRSHPAVEYAQRNNIIQLHAIPNDPSYSRQYAHQRIRSESAWEIEHNSPRTIVGIVDTGVDLTHPDLQTQIIPGYDFANNDSEPQDDNGHGTHVAGIVAAKGNNAIGVCGATWSSQILPVKIFDAYGYTTDQFAVEGLIFAADNGADVINMSWGGPVDSPAIHDAIRYAHSLGIVLVAAAGNSGSEDLSFPAAYDQVIAVAATTRDDTRASFSSFGDFVDLAAPGEDILSTYLGQGYTSLSGTSMAAPLVTGFVALLIAHRPDWDLNLLRGGVVNATANIEQHNPNYRNKLGTGRLEMALGLSQEPYPSIRLASVRFDDRDGVFNEQIDAGETVLLYLTIENTWISANNVTAVVSSDNPWITIDQGILSFGEVNTLSSEENLDTPVIIRVAPEARHSSTLNLEVTFVADGIETQTSFSLFVSHSELPGFPKQVGDLGWASAVTADIDRDGYDEIFVNDYFAEVVHGWRKDGTILPGFPLRVPGSSLGVPAIGNIDSDDTLEIVIGSLGTFHSGAIYAWDSDGSMIGGFPYGLSAPYFDSLFGPLPFSVHTVTLADLDSDRRLDLVAGENRFWYYENETSPIALGKIFALNGNGLRLPGWPVQANIINELSSPVVGNISKNNGAEIVINSLSNLLTAYGPSGKQFDTPLSQGDPYQVGAWGLGYAPILADIEGDGTEEIIVKSSQQQAGGAFLHAYNLNGSELDGFPTSFAFPNGVTWANADDETLPATGDLDNDGHLEIVFTVWGYDSSDVIHSFLVVVDDFGTVRPGFPVELAKDDTSYFKLNQSQPVIGDVNGDSFPDIVLAIAKGEILAYDRFGAPLANFPIKVDGNIFANTLVLSDIDRNGKLDLVIGTSLGYTGKLHALALDAPYSPDTLHWPMYQHDAQHSGRSHLRGLPPGILPVEIDSDQDGLSNSDEAVFGTNPNKKDTDGDGVFDGREVRRDRTSPLDRGSARVALGRETCTEWNSALSGLSNVLELANVGNQALQVEIALHLHNGLAQGRTIVSVKKQSQRDILLHELPGWKAGQIGIVCVSHSGLPGALDGRVVQYHQRARSTSSTKSESLFDYALAFPLENGVKGNQAVLLNTLHPGLNAIDRNKKVSNWVHVLNHSKHSGSGTLNIYDQRGSLLQATKITLAPHGRVDIPAHRIISSGVGLARWIPKQRNRAFTLRVARYIHDSAREMSPTTSAFALDGGVGSGEVIVAPFDSRRGLSVLELANTRNVSVDVNIELTLEHPTRAIKPLNVFLSPHQSKHIVLQSEIGLGTGMVTVNGSKRESIFAAVTEYHHGGSSNTFRSAFGVRARQPGLSVLYASYNTFLGQGCEMGLADTTGENAMLRYLLRSSSGEIVSDISQPLEVLNSVSPCSPSLLNQSNDYGIISLSAPKERSLIGYLLRTEASGAYSFPVPFR